MTILLGFLGTKIGRYCILAVVILITATAVIAHYRARAIQLGEDNQKAQDLEQQKTALLKDNLNAKDQLAHAQGDAIAAGMQTKQAMDLASRAQVVIDGLSSQMGALQKLRAQQDAAIVKIPDSDLARDIQIKLGVRNPGDSTPGFTPLEMRVIDGAVTDSANLQKQNDALQQKTDEMFQKQTALAGAIDGAQKQIQAVTAERDIAIIRWNAAMVAYEEAYNEFPRNRSLGQKVCRVLTFSLACKPKKLKLPAQEDLKSGKAA
jgi:hypothetical protein